MFEDGSVGFVLMPDDVTIEAGEVAAFARLRFEDRETFDALVTIAQRRVDSILPPLPA